MSNTILYNDSGLSKKDIQRIKNKSTKKSIHKKTDGLKNIDYKNIYNKKQDKIILNNDYNTKNKDTNSLYNGLIKTNNIKTNIQKNNSNISVNQLIKDFDIKSKSTTEIVTIKDSKGCDLNFIYNIIGGPKGKDGKDGPTGPGSGTGVTYSLGQDVGTTSDVEFKSVSVSSNSYSLGVTTVTATQWNHLATMDQDVNTTSDVTFNSVTATTSYTLGNTTVTATQWNHLATMDQDVNTTSDVTFNSVTATTSYTLGSTTVTSSQWNYLATMDQDVNTTSDVTFNSVTATTSYTLGNTTVTATQWNHLSTMDQDVNTTSDVTFNSVTATTSYTLGNTTVTATQWNHLSTMDQDVNTTSDVTFNSLTATNSIIVGGDLEVYDSLMLDWTVPNKNLVLNADRKVIPEDKDTITGITNQVIVNQVGRAFTLSTPQDIATTSDVTFNSLTATNSITVGGAGNADSGIFLDVNSTTKYGFYKGSSDDINMLVKGEAAFAFLTNNNNNPFFFVKGWQLANKIGQVGASWRPWDIMYSKNYISKYNSSATEGFFFNGSKHVGIFSPNYHYLGVKVGNNIRCYFEKIRFRPRINLAINLVYSLGSSTHRFNYLYTQNINLNLFTPTSAGAIGDITCDDDGNLIVQTSTEWKKLSLQTF